MSSSAGSTAAKDLANRFRQIESLREAIRRQPITDGSADIADLFARVAVTEPYETGEILISQDGTDSDFFFILSGSVVVSPNGRDDTIRGAQNHVGEMTTIDPAVRRSATVRAAEPVVVARISEPDFSAVADAHPAIWRHLARELAERLRQRVRTVPVRKDNARVFIASSSEALPIANALKASFRSDPYDITIWTDGIFVAGMTNIEALEEELSRSDFAIILLSPDDRVLSRFRLSRAPRDNLILELGLFIGAIGRRRAIMVHPRGAILKIPTDLLGVTPIKYALIDLSSVTAELRAIFIALGPK
jgi:CRP/FNR family transcriptional regulator, cyclic AMP receptor protein